MATRNPNFASPVEFNFFGYRVVDNNTHRTADNVTASFRYRGYEVALTTHDPAGAKVIVLCNKVLVAEHGTVEAAIVAIDELMNWQGANRQARDAAMRHGGRRCDAPRPDAALALAGARMHHCPRMGRVALLGASA